MNSKGKFMNISLLLRRVPLLIGIFAIVLTTSFAFAKENGKAKAKGKEKAETVGKHGREEGELPYGLERHTDKNGKLPSGLEKKKNKDGSLTRGLEDGGKPVSSSTTTKVRK
jgi:hypothetical protein